MDTFSKAERLCSKKIITQLFENNNSLTVYPFKILWLIEKKNEQNPVKILVSVPKKSFKSSVERNLLRRRIKEAYRINKSELLDLCLNKKINISFILLFLKKEISDFKFINSKVTILLKKMILSCEKADN
jgi:ribonuclease P protein component